MLEEDLYLGKIADVELKDHDWERLHNVFEGSKFHLLVDRQGGAGSDRGVIVMELDTEPSCGFEVLAVVEDKGDGALWDQMIGADESGDYYLPEASRKNLLSKGEKLFICEKYE